MFVRLLNMYFIWLMLIVVEVDVYVCELLGLAGGLSGGITDDNCNRLNVNMK